ncbi:MAG: YkgJ family cysteine cluster protein [Proteobacteria bacterium]|nr:YkgJ family cysteine cluster protein [Pseudomonadota bacterium]
MRNPVTTELHATFDTERRMARAQHPPDLAKVRTQTVHMYGRLEALQEQVIADTGVALACAKGCSYCCHLRVEIRAHDAFVLAHHLRTQFSLGQQAAALARIEANLHRIAELTPEQHVRAGIPCALLEDGACSAYAGRPATCRKYYSVSVDTCRNAYNDTAAPLTGEIQDETVRLAGNAVALGYAKGLEDAGYDTTLYELHFALHAALTQPKADKRYRQGKRPFVAVQNW